MGELQVIRIESIESLKCNGSSPLISEMDCQLEQQKAIQFRPLSNQVSLQLFIGYLLQVESDE